MKARYRAFAVVVAVAAIAAAAWTDTAAYRSAVKSPQLAQDTRQHADRLEADVLAYQACNKLRDDKGGMTAAGRDCLVQAMPGPRSEEGALMYAAVASSWLLKHPDDSGVRDAALVAIDKGRAALVDHAAFYRAWDAVNRAHDASVLLRLKDGKVSEESKFVFMADGLDMVQYAVMLPQVARAQTQWRILAAKG
jgi:hypothetical protein